MDETFEDCEISSSTNDEMRDIAAKLLVNLRSNLTSGTKQIDGLEAIYRITRDVLSDGNQSEEGK